MLVVPQVVGPTPIAPVVHVVDVSPDQFALSYVDVVAYEVGIIAPKQKGLYLATPSLVDWLSLFL